jgi:hypothetical protein
MVTEADLRYQRGGSGDNSVWEVAIPWSNKTQLRGFEGKEMALSWSVSGDELFSLDHAARITLTAGPPAPAGFAVSAGQGGANPDDDGRAVAVDAAGNTYVAGMLYYADGIADSPNTRSGDIFVAKYTPAGALAWKHTIGSSGDDRAYGVALDSSGNVYVTGAFQKTVDFDPGGGTRNLTSAGGFDIFVLKLDANGVHQWSHRFGGSGSMDFGYAMAVDPQDNILVTGEFSGTADFNPTSSTLNLKTAGSTDIFVLKLTGAGGLVWAQRLGGRGADRATAIATDSLGRVYTTGSFRGTVDFNPGSSTYNLTSAGSTDIFVSGLSAKGGFSFARRMGGSLADEGHAIQVDADYNVYTTGYFHGTADFDPGSGTRNLTSAGYGDVFLSKLSGDSRSYVFAKRFGGSSNDRGRGLVLTRDGGVALTGQFIGTVDFDPGSGVAKLKSAGSTDVFVARFSSTGAYLWAQRMGGSGSDLGRGIARDADDNLYVTGAYQGTAAFNTGAAVVNLTSTGGKDIFVTKIVGGTTATPLAAEQDLKSNPLASALRSRLTGLAATHKPG